MKPGFTALPFDVDQGLPHRAAVGLVVLATDQIIEMEMPRLAGGDGVGFYVGRLDTPRQITPQSLGYMEHQIADCLSVILPGVHLDVVAFCCTSGAIMIGEEKVRELVGRVRPEALVTTPITAARAALDALGIRSPAVVAPYSDEVNEEIARYLAERGYRVASFVSFGQEDDTVIARIAPDSVRRAVRTAVAQGGADGVFVSCTNLRTLSDIPALEAEFGIPVLSSNQVLAWHVRRLAGLPIDRPDLGRIFMTP